MCEFVTERERERERERPATMLLGWSLLSNTLSRAPPSSQSKKHDVNFLCYSNCNVRYGNNFRLSGSCSTLNCRLGVGFEDVAAIVHNKVLVAAVLSAVIGQMSKPFTSALLYRRTFNLKAAIQAGGFPSTHSSMVVATATSLGLERGFSDSFFGVTIVYATLIMYDAQGVRREVGKHAKTINKMLLERRVRSATTRKGDALTGSPQSVEQGSLACPLLSRDTKTAPMDDIVSLGSNLGMSNDKQEGEFLPSGLEPDIETANPYFSYLNESVGHTELEVIAGALLGFFVSFIVYSLT
ncbi:hypothetical protein Nepgr_009796 [Nepenthes gracilis]|uniref:Acid phosphatase/vanadium-dependent haloperoxidase-related protein n=1 Tax=Nepenthes gracilis TaxID=150966 RepID=A0AAD3SC19_NEPGR|nr:hypothetical protein Nepgr_009796 [Nepenthes gracilis]